MKYCCWLILVQHHMLKGFQFGCRNVRMTAPCGLKPGYYNQMLLLLTAAGAPPVIKAAFFFFHFPA